MRELKTVILNETGLHSRPADLFVRTAKLYASRITVHNGEKRADAKNILKVLLLNVSQGEEVRIVAEGEDAVEAIGDLKTLIESDFCRVNPAVDV
ncbi:MAG: HPr family phosphocarrier protein [Spirochaetaceae bacterium]|nr:MAG: HPr family phosphocarrier protein [Spirochaetaceae bacterium]